MTEIKIQDKRKLFIINTACNFFSYDVKLDEKGSGANDPHLDQFLDDISCFTLFICRKDDNLHMTHEVSGSDDKSLLFLKIKATTIDLDNMMDVLLVSSMVESPLTSLYQLIQNVYGPATMKMLHSNIVMNSKLEDSFFSLQTVLKSILFRNAPDGSKEPFDANAFEITSIEDEIEYWKVQLSDNSRLYSSDAVETAVASFENILKSIRSIDTNSFSQIEDFLDNTFNTLDDIWKQEDLKYPEQRMRNTMDIVGIKLTSLIQQIISPDELWTQQFILIDDKLSRSIELCDSWCSMCEKLTKLYWSNYSQRTWSSGGHTPVYVRSFSDRLKKTKEIRAYYNQLQYLMPKDSAQLLTPTKCFQTFSDINAFHFNSYTEHLWESAVKEFYAYCQPGESAVISKVVERFQLLNNNLFRIVQEFKSFKELMQRPMVESSLIAERENLLTLMQNYVSMVRSDSGYELISLSGMPPLICQLHCMKQYLVKVEEIEENGFWIVKSLDGFDKLESAIADLKSDLKIMSNEHYSKWIQETNKAVANNSLGLNFDEPVVKFEEGKLMKVNYKESLVSFMKNVRLLSAMGYPVDSKLRQLAETAKGYTTHAKALNQIASFHNTIGDRMIYSQRAMMLDSARELARMVQLQNTVSWTNTKQVEQYIKRLESTVGKLARQNNILAHHHKFVMSCVESLMNADLLKEQRKWKENIRAISAVVKDVEEKFTGSKSWRIHIDYQIYKSLECQYIVSLEHFMDHTPVFHLDLIYRHNSIQYIPSLIITRKIFYKKLKKFLMIPQHIHPFGETSIFQLILRRNAIGISVLYSQVEETFKKLVEIEKSWRDWVMLNSRFLDTLAEQYLGENFDWDANFKACKSWAQQISKVTRTEHKIGCFTINTVRVKNEAELQSRIYWDSLIMWLKSSISKDVVRIEEFLNNASNILTMRPQNIDDIGESNIKHQKLFNEGEEIFKCIEEIERRDKVLRSWTREGIMKVKEIKNSWSNYKTLTESYSFIIEKQVEIMKEKLSGNKAELDRDIENLTHKWNQLKPQDYLLIEENMPPSFIIDSVNRIDNAKEELSVLTERIVTINDECIKLNMEAYAFPSLEKLESDIEASQQNFTFLQDFNKDLEEIASVEWIILRNKVNQQLEKLLSHWENLAKSVGSSTAKIRLQRDIDKYKEVLPLLKYVRGESFTESHWLEVYKLLDMIPKTVDKLTLYDFLQVNDKIIQNISSLQEINNRAASEVIIRQALTELDLWEVEAKFSVSKHSDSKGNGILIIQDLKTTVNKVGDHQSLLQSIKMSPHYQYFEERASAWEKKLSDLDNIIRLLSDVQRKWLYLEPVLSGNMIEKGEFDYGNQQFMHIIAYMTNQGHRVMSVIKYNNLTSYLVKLRDNFNQCQRSLLNYLEEKRLQFPKFYFLSDDDLLEILGQYKKTDVLQKHLKKIFYGINSVQFEGNLIVAICSALGEIVKLDNKIECGDKVEEWLKLLDDEIKTTLKSLLQSCLVESDFDKYPSQVLCLAERILFTKECEKAIDSKKLHDFRLAIENRMETYTRHLSDLSTNAPKKTVNLIEFKLKSLLLDTIYHKELVDSLIKGNVVEKRDWSWQKRLRFYEKNCNVTIRMVDAQFSYSYEYHGNIQKLVHTPLTEKCYLTLTQAMNMGLGGNPYGPAGTGKTESVKALGNLLGRQVLVFNCDEGIDAKSFSRILVGLIKCGAWGCFDEFNRLEETTMSAISQNIRNIQEALRNSQPSVILLSKEVEINKNAGIFVTMNPAAKGYGGRQKLPENLKQLFRPVVMARPNDCNIAAVILHTEGFKQAEDLGNKLVTLFDLSRKLLSSQTHYDWGLRALKTVLSSCGSALRQHSITNQSRSQNVETDIIVQAVRINTLCKLTFSDSTRFDELIKDVFPSANFIPTGSSTIKALIKDSCSDLGLIYNERQCAKCLELYEQLRQRIGVVIVGPPGSGKSTVIKILKHALEKEGYNIRLDVISPKSMTRTQLLGHVDSDTREWYDGVLTSIAQQVYSEKSNIECWVHCDGDIDPDWIESLNSVLDDNRLLTLPSGWRIQFGSNVHFLFETDDLTNASPATISRMGMIFLSERDIDIQGIVESWLLTIPSEKVEVISSLVEEYFYKALLWFAENGTLAIKCSIISTLRNGLSLISKIECKKEFAVALIQGIGANLVPQSKELFAEQVMQWTKEYAPRPLTNIWYNKELDCIEAYENDISISGDSLLVHTAAVKSSINVLQNWLDTNESFIVVGQSGSGKSLVLEHALKKLKGIQVETLSCSTDFQTHHVTERLAQTCILVSSNKGPVYKPKYAEKLIIHFTNINYVKPDKWGATMLVNFLQQIITYNGFYDTNLEWMGIENIQIVCSVTTGDTLSLRFISVNKIINFSIPEKSDLKSIFSIYMQKVISDAPSHSSLAAIMVDIYWEIKNNFSAIQYSHYLFSPRDLTLWCKNLNRYEISDLSSIIEALFYEGERLFKDKLALDSDKAKFDEIIKEHFSVKYNEIVNKINLNEISFIRGDNDKLQRISNEEWEKCIKRAMAQLDGDMSEGRFVAKELSYLSSVAEHALSEPGAGLMLVGKQGLGRKSALRLVANRLNAHIFSPKISKTYTLTNFKKDIKTVIQQATVDNEQVYILLEDYQIVHINCLGLMNTLISTGDVSGIFGREEFDNIKEVIIESMQGTNFGGTPMEYIKLKIRQNIHAVFILDSDHTHFLPQCQSSPELIKKSYICWMSKFSDETLKKLPRIVFQEIDEISSLNETWNEYRTSLILSCGKMHKTVSKYVDVSPFRYSKFLEIFVSIYKDKKKSTMERQKNLEAGVSRIMEVRNTVDNLEKQASERKTLLAEKQSKSNEVLDKISATMAYANTRRDELEARRQKAQTENDALQIRKNEINQELSKIEPLIQEARAAVGNIKAEALSEIRSLRVPPDIVRDILEGVLRLMGIRDTSWYSMRTFLASRGVKEDIRCFDATQITKDNRESVEELLEKQKYSFDPSNAKRASAAAAPLAAWVIANVQYSKVLENIKPLEDELEKIQRNLKMYTIQIDELGLGLKTADDTVEKLKEQLSTTSREVAEIEIHIRKAEETILAARGLVNKLDDEFSIWKKQLSELSSSTKMLPFNCLLASGFTNYLGKAAEELRNTVLEEWKRVLNRSEDFSLTDFFCTETELLQWSTESLPSDQLSRENAVILKTISYHPFLTDPSNVSLSWLTNHYKDKSIELTTFTNSRFYNQLELSIRFGKMLIIQDVGEINPSLMPILRKDFIHQGPRKMIHIGEKLVDYNDDFKLILISRSSYPEITPDMSATLAIINFTSTKEGLMQQLLRTVIRIEKPALEENRIKIMQEVDNMKYKLHNLQEKVLKELACAEGDILENKDLLLSLDDTKKSSSAIWKSLEESSKLQNELDQECQLYKSFASHASTLYFACSSLKFVNNMYSISLKAFLRLFESSVTQSKGLKTTEGKCQTLVEIVHNYISRSLFKTDRLMFALHLLHKVHPDKVPDNEWELFLGKSITDHKVDVSQQNIPKLIDKSRVQDFINVQVLRPELIQQMQLDKEELWSDFIKEKNPRGPNQCNLTQFQVILAVQLLRPERLYTTLSSFALKTLALQSLSPKNTNLNELFKESLPDEPILLIISAGADPSEELNALARVKSIKCTEISLGEIEIQDMANQLVAAAKTGTWLLMKNLHLMTSWIPILEKEFKSMSFYHENFRLWLTTEQHDHFSPLLLNMCLKVTYEAPQGIKHNLERTYNMWLVNNEQTSKSEEGGKMLLALAWFHAVLQERRSYIPQGWAKYYEFNDSDFSAALTMLKNIFKSGYDNDLNIKYIQGLCEQAIYGGRIDNVYDHQVLLAYLKSIFNKNVFSSSNNTKPLAPGVLMPSVHGREDHYKFIKNLPENDQPMHFGLPDNIENAWQQAMSLNIINKLKDLDNEETTALNKNGKEWSQHISLFLKIWKKIHKDANLPHGFSHDIQTAKDPLEAYIMLELTFSSDIIRKIHHCLVIISKVLKGVTLASVSVSQAIESLVKQKTPEEWQQSWSGPKNPVKYIRSVIARATALYRIHTNQEASQDKPFDLSEIFNPASYLSAIQLHKAKLTGKSCNDLKLTLPRAKGNTSGELFSVNGLLLEGAIIDKGKLSKCLPDSPSAFNCTTIKLAFQQVTLNEEEESIRIPVYTSPSRTQVVSEILFPCDSNEKIAWTKAGLAFYIKDS